MVQGFLNLSMVLTSVDTLSDDGQGPGNGQPAAKPKATPKAGPKPKPKPKGTPKPAPAASPKKVLPRPKGKTKAVPKPKTGQASSSTIVAEPLLPTEEPKEADPEVKKRPSALKRPAHESVAKGDGLGISKYRYENGTWGFKFKNKQCILETWLRDILLVNCFATLAQLPSSISQSPS